jgi:mono/diheme cytochrome c family protein
MKRRPEVLALSIILLALVAFPASIFGYQAWRTASAGVRVVDIVARTPEQGGFAPDRLALTAGETVRLRLTSPDVVHGFTIPRLGVNVDEIYPGKVVEVDVTPTRPGRYAFACTRWCGVDHWRMRGVIEVVGAAGEALPTEPPPLYQRLGIDLDAPPQAAHARPATQPSARDGAALNVALPAEVTDVTQRQTLPPVEEFQRLRGDPANAGLGDDDLWNLVAWAWLKDTKPETSERAERLFTRDCAACHGPDGKGKGPAGLNLPGMAKMDPTMPRGPVDFTDAGLMLAASDVLLQGKLLRGGMGTGMPEFGSLYSDEEQWAMIAYLRKFLFRQ